jgi:hypothetical protein
MKKIIFTLLIICSVLASCTKVINIDLNAANPNIVVDAQITDQAGPYTVNLTQTVNFSDNNNFPPITGATVIISDNAGNTETLTEAGNGNYITSHLQGTVGKAYHISITSNNKNYIATSIMPAPVAIDSVVADTSSSRRGGGFGGGGTTVSAVGVSVHAVFTDLAGVANYYRLIEYVNHVPNYSNITIISDQGIDGSVIARSITRRDTSIHAGDTITVALESIDANVYEYYRTLRLTTRNQTGIQTSTPGNPTTNLSNNALGVFSAYAVRTKYTIAP